MVDSNETKLDLQMIIAQVEAYEQRLKSLKIEVTMREDLIKEMTIKYSRLYPSPAASLTFGPNNKLQVDRCHRLTTYLVDTAYPKSDILWVGAAIVYKMANSDTLELTPELAARWNLESAAETNAWMVDEGMAVWSDGQMIPTAKLVTLLNAGPVLRLEGAT